MVMLEALEDRAQIIRDERRTRNYEARRQSMPVPKEIGELELLAAVYDAVEKHDAKVRGYRWYQESVERGEDADARAEGYLGYAMCDEIAQALVGAEEEWMVKFPRRVVKPLGRLLAAGFVCRGVNQNGYAYGYELTDEGAAMLRVEYELCALPTT